MADVTLAAAPRTDLGSRESRRLRREGRIPAVLYGTDVEATQITVDARDFGHIISSHSGYNTLIRLELDGQEYLTLPRETQIHPIRRSFEHVDFVKVNPDVKVVVDVPVHLIGESIGVKSGGVLDQVQTNLKVAVSPNNIPDYVEVDVTPLDLGDQLRGEDVKLPEGVQLKSDPRRSVVVIMVPRGLKSQGASQAAS
ncbi:MAG: 50S ribosomal protein L25 [Acidimicrobiia bacterium]|jgi:large subunit ribosomal protein L25|nr:50S ribosomal protein L25 [Acidimicrobiia bacterium]MBP8179945.1 50S ribosomal protein L25 [Acidimicrobiia bacterium]